MKFKLYLILIASTTCVNSYSQQTDPSIIGSAGGISSTNDFTLEWTLGEIATESVTSFAALYTQGYHQSVLIIEKMAFRPAGMDIKKINVFPNPASSTINIQLGFTPKSALSVSLFDMNEKLLQKKEIPSNNKSLQLDVSQYAKGIYLLKINSIDAGIFQSYKIIKAQ